MNSRTKTGLEILQVAAVLGVLGNILLRSTPWGLNVTLYNIAFAAGLITLLWRHAPAFLTRQTIALLGALVFFASMFSWRDAIELRIADTFAIIAVLSVIFIPRMKIATQLAGVFQYFVAFFWSGLGSIFSPFLLLVTDLEWNEIPRSGRTQHVVSVLRGLAIVMPLLLIFGGLFVAADAIYAGWVQRVISIQPETVVTHVVLTAVFAWLSAGYLRNILIQDFGPIGSPILGAEAPAPSADAGPASETSPHLPNNLSILEHINLSDPPNPSESSKDVPPATVASKRWNWAAFDNTLIPAGFTLGTVEIGIILGSMNLLFLSFVVVQVPYLFGGMDLVQGTPDFKLADYARRGFGELVAVSALVLPILLASHWLIRKTDGLSETLFRVLAGVQIALLFVIMASATQRLFLLTGELGYGLTTIRLYPMIFMSWLAIVFVWFGVTVLRGARQHFAWGALWSAFLILGATHVLNPDRFIVRTNIALTQQGREFDALYNSNLSDDSIPSLVDGLGYLSFEDRCKVGSSLHNRYKQLGQETDFRSWNMSRRAAWTVLGNYEGSLHQTEGCPEQFLNDRNGNPSFDD